jgi:hypothetical protein
VEPAEPELVGAPEGEALGMGVDPAEDDPDGVTLPDEL